MFALLCEHQTEGEEVLSSARRALRWLFLVAATLMLVSILTPGTSQACPGKANLKPHVTQGAEQLIAKPSVTAVSASYTLKIGTNAFTYYGDMPDCYHGPGYAGSCCGACHSSPGLIVLGCPSPPDLGSGDVVPAEQSRLSSRALDTQFRPPRKAL